jgi:hypothetical protein
LVDNSKASWRVYGMGGVVVSNSQGAVHPPSCTPC